MDYNLSQSMKKILVVLFFNFLLLFAGALPARLAAAQAVDDQPRLIAQTGACGTLTCPSGKFRSPIGNGMCECDSSTAGSGAAGDDVFGTIEAPAGVAEYNAAAGETGIGLLAFFSNMIRIATVAAGVWVMVNFILAGWSYITSAGEVKAHTEAAMRMTYSVVGLAVIVGAYTLTAIVSLVLFGDAGYILSPTFQGPAGP